MGGHSSGLHPVEIAQASWVVLDDSKVRRADGHDYAGAVVEHLRLAGAHVSRIMHPPGQRIEAHSHDWPVLTLYRLGGYREEADCGAAIDLDGPSVVFQPAGAAHADEIGDRGLETLSMTFDPSLDLARSTTRFARLEPNGAWGALCRTPPGCWRKPGSRRMPRKRACVPDIRSFIGLRATARLAAPVLGRASCGGARCGRARDDEAGAFALTPSRMAGARVSRMARRGHGGDGAAQACRARGHPLACKRLPASGYRTGVRVLRSKPHEPCVPRSAWANAARSTAGNVSAGAVNTIMNSGRRMSDFLSVGETGRFQAATRAGLHDPPEGASHSEFPLPLLRGELPPAIPHPTPANSNPHKHRAQTYPPPLRLRVHCHHRRRSEGSRIPVQPMRRRCDRA